MGKLMKVCAHCGKELDNPRKKFCNDSHRWHYNMLKKEREKHLPPVKKRNREWFKMVTGSEWASRKGQGKRSGHMVQGAMAAMVRCTVEVMTEVTKENIEKHLSGIPGYTPNGIELGDGTYIRKENIYQELEIKIIY